MTYPTIDTVVNSSTDLSQLLVYVNLVSNGYFGPLVLYSFFLITLLGGYYAQKRFVGRAKWDTAWLAASFVTTGLAVIMITTAGVLNYIHAIICSVLFLAGLIAVVFSETGQ